MGKKIKLNIAIPQNLSQISLGEYQKYLKVVEANKDDENAGDFLNLKALEIFCGLELKDTYNLPMKHFHFALEQLEVCFKEETPLVHEFTFRDPNGVDQQMGFIPKLDEMTFGEYVDLDKWISDWQTMHKAMAVLYRPIRVKYKDKYKIDDYDGKDTYHEAMKEMPVSYAIGAMLFFYRLGTKLSASIIPYLANLEELSSQQKDDLQKIGDGIQVSLHYAMTDLLTSIGQQKFLYTKQ